MTKRPSTFPSQEAPARGGVLRRLLRPDRTFGVIDAALAAAAISMAMTRFPVHFFIALFLLLMIGGCFWSTTGFAARCFLWTSVALAELILSYQVRTIEQVDLLIFPLLCIMLGVVFWLQSSRRDVERSLIHAADHDALTRLPNRAEALRQLDRALGLASSRSAAVAVASLDIDGLKAVNDEYGHSAGDQVLIALSERLRHCVRTEDTVARVGGDEFLIVCEIDAAIASRIAARLAAAVEKPMTINGAAVRITASVGMAVSDAPGELGPDALVRHADAAMRRVKAEGRAGFEVLSPMREAAAA